MPKTIASRRVPFDISRSSVFVCRSRAIASALIAAVKNTNIVKYPGSVKLDARNGFISPTVSVAKSMTGGISLNSASKSTLSMSNCPRSASMDAALIAVWNVAISRAMPSATLRRVASDSADAPPITASTLA